MENSKRAYEEAKLHVKEKERNFKAAICKANVREFLPKAVKSRLSQLVKFVSTKIDAETIHVEKTSVYQDFFAGKFPPDKQLFLFDLSFSRDSFHIIGHITRERVFGVYAYFKEDKANDLLTENDQLFERILAAAAGEGGEELKKHQLDILRLQFLSLIKSFLKMLCDNLDKEFGEGMFVRADALLRP